MNIIIHDQLIYLFILQKKKPVFYDYGGIISKDVQEKKGHRSLLKFDKPYNMRKIIPLSQE